VPDVGTRWQGLEDQWSLRNVVELCSAFEFAHHSCDIKLWDLDQSRCGGFGTIVWFLEMISTIVRFKL